MKAQHILLTCLSALLLNACGDSGVIKTNIVQPKQIVIKANKPDTPVFVRITNIKDKLLNKRVSINQQAVSLIDAINLVMPSLSVIAKDSHVKLNRKISIRANNLRFGDYLKQLSNASKYHITINGNIVNVASNLNKSWDLSTLSLSDPVSNNTNQSIVVQNSETQDAPQSIGISSQSNWQSLVNEITKVLGQGAVVSSNEKLGSIHASATPDKIQLANTWIAELITGSQKQVSFQASIIETSIDNASATGIDFSLINKGTNGDFGISLKAGQSIDGAGVISIGSLLKTPLIFGDVNLEFLLNLLKRQGQVKVSNYPNILAKNGVTATLQTGNDIDYIASVASVTDQSGNVVTTPVIKQQNSGLKINLTAKVSKNNKLITVNFTPSISAIRSRTTLQTGSGQSAQEVTLLDVALTEFSTQVIIKPGQSVLIGGLYADNLSQSEKGTNNAILDSVFGSSQNSNSKREILILLTANLITP